MTAKLFVLCLFSAVVVCQASLLSISACEMQETQAGARILTVTLASAPGGTPLDVDKVRTRTCIFERGPRQTVEWAKPDLTFRWLEGPVNWKDTGLEKCSVTYPAPQPGYTYVGYGTAVYYDGVLQQAVFSRKSLQKRFPFPKTLNSLL